VGSVDPDFKNQTHDFNPGIAASGLFWTIAVPASAVQFDVAAGTATLNVTNVPLFDYNNVPNSLTHGKNSPATASLQVRWTAAGAAVVTRDDKLTWNGALMPATATCAWSAQTTGFSYTTDAANTSKTIFAMLGRETNGRYFQPAFIRRLGDG
jgi:hypothetical protein